MKSSKSVPIQERFIIRACILRTTRCALS